MASERNVPRPRIRQWNCRSLRRRHAELVQLLPRIDCDVFALQETHVRAEEIKIPGDIGYSGPTSCATTSCSAVPCYDAAHRTGAPRTAIYVRTSLPHVVVSVGDLVSDAVECCAVIVRVRNTDTAVASVYVRPGVSWNAAFVEKLSDRLGKDAVICGDFNAHNTHWGCQGTNRRGRELLAATQAARLNIINDGSPTHIQRVGQHSAIDLSLVTGAYLWEREADTQGSDHYPTTLIPSYRDRAATRCYSVVRWAKFRELSSAPVPVGKDYFAHVAQSARTATARCTVPIGAPVPDVKLLNLRAARRAAQRRAIRTRKPEHWTLCNRLDAACRRHAVASSRAGSASALPWETLAALTERGEFSTPCCTPL
ncbi:hypothetical protein V5799_027089 [Amblyomma americanum]|uniref:Endonuclease/exonuclease/phosphatase domain-containing protein n=1 Tax=Amblyomma americanum TaxID=6943 RepID=A0AAQ4DGQ4_AMBAM